MPFKSKKIVVLAKTEVTLGLDSVPTGAANAMLVANAKLTPMVQDAQGRSVMRPWFANEGKIPAGEHVELSFDVEIAGSGAAGTAPGWGTLMKGCAMSETVVALTSVTYAPISSGEQTLSMYFNMDGVQHRMLGSRGTASFKFSKGGVPMMSFKFVGLYALPTDTVMPAPTFTAFQKPLAVTQANTTPVSLHGFAGKFSDISFDLANSNSYRNLMGVEDTVFGGRTPTGSCTLEAVSMATKDWFSIAKAGTTGILTLTHGTVAGNKVKFDALAVQVTNPAYSDADNIAMIGLTLDLQPSAGNDELTITVL